MVEPLYKAICKKIDNDIKSNAFNGKLPSENQMAKGYGVNRHTIRKALQILKDDGFIHSVKGCGNFITNIHIQYTITDTSSFSSIVQERGYEPKTEILSAKRIKVDETLTKFFKITEQMDVFELKLLRYADGVPIYVTYSYFDAYRYKKLFKHLNLKPFSLYKLIHLCYPKRKLTKISTTFEAINPNSDIRKNLKLPLHVPVLKTRTYSQDQFGNPAEYGFGYMRGDTCKVDISHV